MNEPKHTEEPVSQEPKPENSKKVDVSKASLDERPTMDSVDFDKKTDFSLLINLL